MSCAKRKSQKNRSTFHIRFEPLEARVLLAADWQNPINPYDVDASDEVLPVAPLDVLKVITELSERKFSAPVTGVLPQIDPENVTTFFDVDGDGIVSPSDAVSVINELHYINQESAIEPTQLSLIEDRVLSGTRAALSNGVEHDTLVNSATDRKQSEPAVAAGSGGDIVVVWQSRRQDGSSWGVYAQRYDASGAKVGDEIPVNATTKHGQRAASVAVRDDGSFVVVWNSWGQDGSGWGIYGQEFDMSGMKVGDEFRVNETTKGPQVRADVAIVDGGDFVVAWEGRGVGDKNGIFMRRFAPDSTSSEILVNTPTRGDQSHVAIAPVPGGDFVLTWEGKGPDDARGIYLRRVSDGVLGEQIRVNDRTRGSQRLPDVAVGANGQMVVTWKQHDGRGWGVRAKQFDASGNAESEIQVNQTVRGSQKRPTAAYLADGRFAVSWYGRGRGDRWGTFTRTFLADGTPESDELLVNTTTRSAQKRPSSAAVNNGYVVAWQGRGIGDRSGVFARFFSTESVDPFGFTPILSQTVSEGQQVAFTASVVDLDGVADNVTFSLDPQTTPEGASIDPVTGEFIWNTDEQHDGQYEVDVTAAEGDFRVTRTASIAVNEVNQAPVLESIDDVTSSVNLAVAISLSATDADLPANPLSFDVTLADGSTLPNWLSFDAATQTLSGTPDEADIGTVALLANVTDDGGLGDSQMFNVNVVANPFSLEVADTQSVSEGSELSFTATIDNTDGQPDDVTLSATGVPSGATFDAATGVFSWTPTESDGPGDFIVTLTAASNDFTTSRDVAIAVIEVNEAPVLAGIDDQTVTEGSPLSVGVVAIDPDIPANDLTYAVTLADGGDLPNWLEFDTSLLILSGIPAGSDAGTLMLRAAVTDNDGLSDETTFEITVLADSPVLVNSIPDFTVEQDMLFALAALNYFSDPNADLLTMTATADGGGELPSWLSFDGTTGVLEGTPTIDFVGTSTTIEIVAADPDGNSVSDTFDLSVVTDTNIAPVVSDQVFRVAVDADAGAVVGSLLASDADDDDLVFSIISGTPGRFELDSETGMITVGAAGLQAGVETLTVSVSDGTVSTMTTTTIYMTSEPIAVEYSLQAFDTDGNQISSVAPGQEIEIRLFIQDTRADPLGAFTAHVDLVYPDELASVGAVTHSSTYGTLPFSSTAMAGLVDELGGTDGIDALGGDQFEVARVAFTVSADATGLLHFTLNEVENMAQRGTLLVGETAAVASERIDFGDLMLPVVDSTTER